MEPVRGRQAVAYAALVAVVAALGATVAANSAQPKITVSAVVPNGRPGHLVSVRGGQQIVVRGSGFRGKLGRCAQGLTVSFGAQPSGAPSGNDATRVRVINDRELTAKAPAANPGRVDVVVASPACGSSPVTAADRVWYSFAGFRQSTFAVGHWDSRDDLCAAGGRRVCTVAVDATKSLGPIRHGASGLLHGLPTESQCGRASGYTPAAPLMAQLRDLNLGSWRVSDGDWGDGTLARRLGTPTIEVVSDDFRCMHGDNVPWAEPSLFRTFAYNLVLRLESRGIHPKYWDVINEPGVCPFCDRLRPPTRVRQDFSNLYAAGLEGIKDADPNAKVLGPSLSAFSTSPAQFSRSDSYDLSTFLSLNDQLVASNPRYHFDAIGWHEIQNCWTGCYPVALHPFPYPLFQPSSVTEHIRAARRLMARHPRTGRLPVIIDEYMPADQFKSPGMSLGYLAALTEGRVALADRTCYGCYGGFDGLFDSAGSPTTAPHPTSVYWLYRAFGSLTGAAAPVTASAADLYGVAARAGNVVRILLGRAGACGPGPYGRHDMCPTASGSPTLPAHVLLRVRVGRTGGSATVNETDLSSASGVPSPAPVLTSQRFTAHNGWLSIPIASVRGGHRVGVVDGDAYLLTVTL